MAESNIQKYASGEDSGWLSYTNPEKFNGTIWYRKIGNIVCIRATGISLVSAITKNTGVSIGTIPSGYAPSGDSCAVAVTSRLLDFPFHMSFYSDPNRYIYVTANNNYDVPASTAFSFSIMYFTN